jgi:hypothetical protein
VAVVQMMVIFGILHHIIKLYPSILEEVGKNIFLQVFEQTFAVQHKTPKKTTN